MTFSFISSQQAKRETESFASCGSTSSEPRKCHQHISRIDAVDKVSQRLEMKINWNNDDEASICGRNLEDAVKSDFEGRGLAFDVWDRALMGLWDGELAFISPDAPEFAFMHSDGLKLPFLGVDRPKLTFMGSVCLKLSSMSWDELELAFMGLEGSELAVMGSDAPWLAFMDWDSSELAFKGVGGPGHTLMGSELAFNDRASTKLAFNGKTALWLAFMDSDHPGLASMSPNGPKLASSSSKDLKLHFSKFSPQSKGDTVVCHQNRFT